MLTADIMTQDVVSVRPTARIEEAIKLMSSNGISGLPVIGDDGALVGIITEGDFLRRAELGTEKRRARWIEFLAGPGLAAADYVQTHARKVADVMTKSVVTVDEDTPLDEVVRLMEKKHIKRVPVMRGKLVVGIISRANLVRALAAIKPETSRNATDADIQRRIIAELKKHFGRSGRYEVTVHNGVANLWGTVHVSPDAARVAAENVPGVTEVRNNLVWIDPTSGLQFS